MSLDFSQNFGLKLAMWLKISGKNSDDLWFISTVRQFIGFWLSQDEMCPYMCQSWLLKCLVLKVYILCFLLTVLNEKFKQLEKQHEMRISELGLRYQIIETASHEGVLMWKINDYFGRKQAAKEGRMISLFSFRNCESWGCSNVENLMS